MRFFQKYLFGQRSVRINKKPPDSVGNREAGAIWRRDYSVNAISFGGMPALIGAVPTWVSVLVSMTTIPEASVVESQMYR